MAITWTKNWSGSDDGTILKGVDLGNIQSDLAGVITTAELTVADVLLTSNIGVTVQAFENYRFWENDAVSYENSAVYIT